jgi:membrane-bound lytic murein transglycosylase D
MKKTIFYLTAFAMLTVALLATRISKAQIIKEQVSVASNYDPIASTLDSLVTLTYVQRLNPSATSATNTAFKAFEVPVYSAEIYRNRIAKIQSPIPLCHNSMVQEYIDLYGVKKRGLTERVIGLSGYYFPMYEQILDQQGLPLEFKYLSIVESALNPTAVSRMGATGLWQFMLGTGKLYDLKINSYIDERRDPLKSTLAACQYFKDMYAIYNDWLLVIAAYNCGAGNVNRAIARSGGKKTFWEIAHYLPRETRGYVPAFIAVTYLLSYPSEHNLIPVPPVMTYFESDTVMVHQQASLAKIAEVINVSPELLKSLNPIYKRGIIPDSDEPMALCLPTTKINTYLANTSKIFTPETTITPSLFASTDISPEAENDKMVKKYHRVKSGEHLQSIAKKYRCSVSDIKNWNKLKGNKLIAGQKLAVYVNAPKKTDKLAANSAPAKPAKINSSPAKKEEQNSDKKFVWHTVQPGDSLWSIAKSYEGVTVEQIRELNNLQSNNLKVGTKLKVVVNG